MFDKFLGLAAAATMFAAGPAWAGDQSLQPGKTKDPNEIVCEKQEVVGSRLAVKRVCKTRAEWAETRAQDRQTIDHAQTMRGTKGE